MIFNNPSGSSSVFEGFTGFYGNSSAATAIITNTAAEVAGIDSGQTYFTNTARAGSATVICNGANVSGAGGGTCFFTGNSTADNAILTAMGGANGGAGGLIQFDDSTTADSARVVLSGNGTLNISFHALGPLTLGSLEGDGGEVTLGGKSLVVGSNDFDTVFGGQIQEHGSVTKTGTGTLTLSGANTYTGATVVSAGALKAANRSGSATGTGALNVNAGTLAGKGTISGAVTIGTGSGSGAFLAPAAGTNVQAMLTIQSALTFNADATYAYTFRAKRNRAKTDQVIASGVMINSGAMIALSGQTQGRLTTGLTLTLISNTSANPITGTFSNLPDGGIITINGNNFQASYEGGDGNDLTLTVVP